MMSASSVVCGVAHVSAGDVDASWLGFAQPYPNKGRVGTRGAEVWMASIFCAWLIPATAF